MNCIADIKALAANKIIDAECLFNGRRFDAAYYTAGYSVELYLKARICKTLGIEDFFDFENKNRRVKVHDNANKAYKVHDLRQLIVLSGILTQMDADMNSDRNLQSAWSVIIDWNENIRYKLGKADADADSMIKSVKIFETWILTHL